MLTQEQVKKIRERVNKFSDGDYSAILVRASEIVFKDVPQLCDTVDALREKLREAVEAIAATVPSHAEGCVCAVCNWFNDNQESVRTILEGK